MAKKSGWVGSKAYTKSDALSGSKCMSSVRMPLSSGEKMSSAHGTNSGNKHNALHNASGAIGADCRTFKKGSV